MCIALSVTSPLEAFSKALILSSKNVSEQFVVNSLVSPPIKLLLTPGGWYEEVCILEYFRVVDVGVTH